MAVVCDSLWPHVCLACTEGRPEVTAKMTSSAGWNGGALIAQLPGGPAGRQLAWWLGMIADEGVRASPTDRDRFAPSLHAPLEALFDAERMHDAWRRDAGRLGAPTEISVDRSGEHDIAVNVATAKDRKWTLTVVVEPDPPHRMTTFRLDRRHDFKLDVREATAAHAAVVADIERRCPIVMGDSSVWFERGEAYFDFSRLMEDCTVGLASVDGIPAAVSCGAEHQVRIGGVIKPRLYLSPPPRLPGPPPTSASGV